MSEKLTKGRSWKKFTQSAWLFPAIIGVVLICLTSFKLSGTSVGVYHNLLYGSHTHDSSLLFGHPQTIRSDEWLFVTQMVIAQSNAGFPRINHNMGPGKDVSVNTDVPYKEWSVLFKPQNLIFFILPLEFAFAFKWWLLLALLIVSVYFFILRLLSGRRLWAAIFSTGFGLSPFVFWWYQTATLAPLFYGFFMLLLIRRLLNREQYASMSKRLSLYLSIGLLTYVLISFALILYPPFQIPIMLVVAALLLGRVLNMVFNEQLDLKTVFRRVLPLVIAAVMALGVVGVFVATRKGAISSLENTIYPGRRVVLSGGMRPFQILSSHLQPQLQRAARAVNYYANQSEASNFLLLLPFLLLPGIAISVQEWRKQRKVDWEFIGIQAVSLLFLAHIFIPGFNLLYKPFFLDKVPHERLIIGLGFAGFIHMLYVIKKLVIFKSGRSLTLVILAYNFLVAAVLIWVGLFTKAHYPKFISSAPAIVALSCAIASIVGALLLRKTVWAGVGLLLFSVACVGYIHPLYRGLGPLEHNNITPAIQAVSRPSDTWVTADDIEFENFGYLSNRDSFSGITIYPDLNLFREIAGPQDDYIYNRYAHVLFNADPAFTQPIKLIQPDSFQVKFSCSGFVFRHVNYVLDTRPINLECVKLVKELVYPVNTVYLYQVMKP